VIADLHETCQLIGWQNTGWEQEKIKPYGITPAHS
jgi:hypothetical protein